MPTAPPTLDTLIVDDERPACSELRRMLGGHDSAAEFDLIYGEGISALGELIDP